MRSLSPPLSLFLSLFLSISLSLPLSLSEFLFHSWCCFTSLCFFISLFYTCVLIFYIFSNEFPFPVFSFFSLFPSVNTFGYHLCTQNESNFLSVEARVLQPYDLGPLWANHRFAQIVSAASYLSSAPRMRLKSFSAAIKSRSNARVLSESFFKFYLSCQDDWFVIRFRADHSRTLILMS